MLREGNKMREHKAVAYIRVSTQGQLEKWGMDAQKEAILEYAKANNLEIIRWYEEVGSGAYEREVFESICMGAEGQKEDFDTVIVFKTDRVARETKLYFYYLYLLEKQGIKLLSTVEEFDEDSGITNLYRSILQFVAEQERKNILMRTMNGRKVKASQGGFVGGKVPYGYKSVNKELVVDYNEIRFVKMCFACLDKGMSLRKTADFLAANGCKNRNGTPCTFALIRSIRDNRRLYEGYYSFNGKEVEGKQERII